jgi:protein TonB
MTLALPYAFAPVRKHVPGGAVVGAVVVLHLAVMWLMQTGLGRTPTPPAPSVVVARLIMQPDAVSQPRLQQYPPESALLPVREPVPAPQKLVAAQPVSASMPQAVTAEPAPVVPILTAAGTQSAASASAASITPAIASAAAPAAASSPTATLASASMQRVSASLQASASCQKMPYPELSSRREEQGTVHLKLLIGADGRVLESQVEQSSGYARLDEAARAGLSKCQFKPGTVDGKPEPSWASMKYTWRLE